MSLEPNRDQKTEAEAISTLAEVINDAIRNHHPDGIEVEDCSRIFGALVVVTCSFSAEVSDNDPVENRNLADAFHSRMLQWMASHEPRAGKA